MSILVPFAALRQTLVSLISHPCLVAVLRLMWEHVAPVSARTCILKVGFPIGFRCKNSGGVRVQAFTLLTTSVIALQVSKDILILSLLLLLVPLLLLLPLVLFECLEFLEICAWVRLCCC
jgi:hypothetical protein